MECFSLLNIKQFYRSSCKRYPALMPFFTDSDARELMLSPEGFLCSGTFTYANTLLKKQVLFLMNEIMRVHDINRNLPESYKNLQPSIFLKKKSSGLLRLDSSSQQDFYEEGVLDLAISGNKEGTLYVYALASKLHVNYFEFSYFFSACN